MVPYCMLCLVFASFLVLTKPQPLNCTVKENKVKHHREIESATILCRHVPSNFLINSYYFVEKPYPQTLIVDESTVPVLSNYSSLLNMRSLRKLILKGLGIRYIVPGAFQNMAELEELDLTDNQLTELHDGTFMGLDNLKKLYMASNNITVEPENAFKDTPNLEFVDFSNNPLENIKPGSFAGDVKVKTSGNS